jgi:hypothetical protein
VFSAVDAGFEDEQQSTIHTAGAVTRGVFQPELP